MRYGSRPVDWYRLTRSVLEERMEQVREFDGEQAYEKMRRAVGEGKPNGGHCLPSYSEIEFP